MGSTRLFWGAQAGSLGQLASVTDLHHIGFDVYAACGVSGAVILTGLVRAWKVRHPDSPDIVHEDHLFWAAQAACWATLAAMSAHPSGASYTPYALLALTVGTCVVALLFTSERTTEGVRLEAEVAELRHQIEELKGEAHETT